MTFTDIFRIVVRRGWIVLLLAVLAAGGAYVLSQRQQAVYRATQTVLIQPSRIDLGLTEGTNRTMESLVQYMDSSLRAAVVIERLNLDMTPQQLKGITTISSNRNNLTIRIDVDLYSGELASDIAREWGNLLIDYRNQQNQIARVEDRVNAVLQDNPTYSLLRPRPAINGVAGGVLGLLLGSVIVLILELIENSVVRSREDVERTLEMVVLASIPEN
ncbi:MAG: YveK family protein [Phototrophicaceae bacterium]|jgi:capsular polysaccharide biosynthesis protein